MTFRKLSRALAAALIVGGAYAASPVYAAETAAPAAEQSAEEQAPFDVQVVEQHVMATITRFGRYHRSSGGGDRRAASASDGGAGHGGKGGVRTEVGRARCCRQAAHDGGQGGRQVVCHL